MKRLIFILFSIIVAYSLNLNSQYNEQERSMREKKKIEDQILDAESTNDFNRWTRLAEQYNDNYPNNQITIPTWNDALKYQDQKKKKLEHDIENATSQEAFSNALQAIKKYNLRHPSYTIVIPQNFEEAKKWRSSNKLWRPSNISETESSNIKQKGINLSGYRT